MNKIIFNYPFLVVGIYITIIIQPGPIKHKKKYHYYFTDRDNIIVNLFIDGAPESILLLANTVLEKEICKLILEYGKDSFDVILQKFQYA